MSSVVKNFFFYNRMLVHWFVTCNIGIKVLLIYVFVRYFFLLLQLVWITFQTSPNNILAMTTLSDNAVNILNTKITYIYMTTVNLSVFVFIYSISFHLMFLLISFFILRCWLQQSHTFSLLTGRFIRVVLVSLCILFVFHNPLEDVYNRSKSFNFF